MNNKGFTLIELLATIILLSLIMTIGTVSIVGALKTSKEESYNILIENVKNAAKLFYEECENRNIIATEIPSSNCVISDNSLTVSYITLLNYGFLKSSSKKDGEKIIENPMNNSSLNGCSIKIIKNIEESDDFKIDGGVSYTFSNEGGASCPTY